jgi:AcrR family transcriptional regulator
MQSTPSTRRQHRSRAPRLPADERRNQIVDVAVQVFARHGYAATGTADIAEAAGIGEPTIYRYFESKRDLYLAACAGPVRK